MEFQVHNRAWIHIRYDQRRCDRGLRISDSLLMGPLSVEHVTMVPSSLDAQLCHNCGRTQIWPP